METNGINLSEMNMLLLKKVEELTLYLIQQETKNQTKDIEIRKLNDRLNELEKRAQKQN